MTVPLDTADLLHRWRAGDAEALSTLLDRDLDWLRTYVHRRLDDRVRRFADTDDLVQETAIRVLQNGPRFIVTDRDQFRALLATVIVNLLHSKRRELFALKRSPARERALGSDTVLHLDPPQESVQRPDEAASEEEQREWLRMALLLLAPRDQEVIDLHWSGLTDVEIGAQLQISDNTARMRRARATERLSATVLKLKNGQLASILVETDAASRGPS